jgi:PAS domain-containing protein
VSSSDRPPPIALDDLADPRFAPEVEAVLALMAEAGASMTLEPEVLMADAKGQTGLDDFGSDDFRERLDLLCAALRNEARLNDAGVMAQALFVGGLLRNRLLLEDLIVRHPEILEVQVSRPIVICGLPRTGTTHLHNLVSCDPGLRSLPYWESLEPVLADDQRPAPGAVDPRVVRTDMALSFVNTAMPELKRMHEMTVDHVHEEIQLLGIDISTMLFETIAPIPTWRDHYLARDQHPSYAYLKRILQALQWLRGGTRWILKSPQHLEQFPALVDTFPDATFVVTHRDPVSVTTSMVTMLGYTARLSHDRVDLEWIGHYWADRLVRMLGTCVEERDVLPDSRAVDVRFDEFMEDDMGTVERIYDLAGQPLTAAARSAMDSFAAGHPRGRHGGILYDLAPFGLDGTRLRSALAFYSDRFGIPSEGGPGE